MPAFSEVQRWVIPAILLLALVGVPVALWWERRRPSVPDNVVELRAWRGLSTAEQAAVDAGAIEAAAGREAARRGAEESAQLAAARAAEVNALFRP